MHIRKCQNKRVELLKILNEEGRERYE